MATNNKNFIVKNGLEVADSLIVANSSNSRVGFGTTSPLFPVDVRNTLALSGDMRVALDGGNPITVNVTGSFSSLEPDVISGLTTTNIRIQDVITSDGKGYISPPTVIVSVGVNSVRLDRNHNLTSGTDTSALVVSRKYDTGDAGDVLISRGPNLPPEWKTEVDPNIVAANNQVYNPILSDGTGVRQLYIDQTGISFDAGNNRLGINSTAPEYTLDVRGDQQLFGKLYVSNGSGTAGQLLTSNGIDKNFWSIPSDLAAGSALSVTAYPTDADQIFRMIFVEDNAIVSQSLYQDSTDGLVFNPRTNRLGIGSTTPTAELDVQGNVSVADSITSGEYFGEGSTIVGIVTQMVPSIGINMTATQTSGKGKVTIDAYKPVGRTIFVAQNGNDDNTGLAENHPKKTVKGAASIALKGDTIKVFPGTYIENNPIVLQEKVAIEGTELRNCIITPRYTDLDLFHVNNSCHVTDLSFVGPEMSKTAAIIAFQPLLGEAKDRYFDAARLIRDNLDFIAQETVGYLTSTDYKNPAITIDSINCVDDIKDVYRAVCHDITRGGNLKCVGAGKSYFDINGSLDHIVGFGATTIDAFEYSVGIAKSCVNNVKWNGGYQTLHYQIRDMSIQADSATGSNSNVNSCANVISAVDTCVGVVTSMIQNGIDGNSATLGITTNYPGNSGFGTNTTYGITTATYDGNTGIVTLTSADSVGKVKVGDLIELRDLNFECNSGSGISTQLFPSGKFGFEFYVNKINDDDTIVANVGVSTIPHTYVSGGVIVDRFVGITSMMYDAATGIATITAPGAYVRVGDEVTLRNLEFACPGGSGITTTIFPDGTQGFEFSVTGVTTEGSQFTTNVGISTINHYYVGSGLARPPYSRGVGPIDQGPYIRNCTNFVAGSIGMKVDGKAAEPGDEADIGVTGSMSVDSYTQFNQAGTGVSITNGAYAQLVSIFTICDDTSIFTGSGGQCDITNSNSSFGTLGLVSDGVGDATSDSIYRYSGETIGSAAIETDTVTITGVGTIRPYDGQAIYFGQLYKSVLQIDVTNGGSGFTQAPTITIGDPTGPSGVTAEAVATIDTASGELTSIDLISTGSQYEGVPTVTITGGGGVGAAATAVMSPIYYTVESATKPIAGISTVVLTQNLLNTVSTGTTAYFSRLSLQITSSHSFEWVGSGNDIASAKPALGGVTVLENEIVKLNGGQIVYTSTNQAGNFQIGDDIVINQLTGTISGRAFNQSLLNTVTPLILGLAK